MPDFGIFRGFSSTLFSSKLFAGQLPIELGLTGSESFAFVGLLDAYPNAAAAYSLRKLRTAYTGSAIRVRNSSNSEADIGFVNNVLDTASLLTHCGSGDGFVKTWYDQSGNGNNATQSIAAQQPKIVVSGSYLGYIENPVTISSQLLTTPYTYNSGVAHSSFIVCQNYGNAVFGGTISSNDFYGVAQSGSTSDSYLAFTIQALYANGSSIGNTRNDIYNATVNFGLLTSLVSCNSDKLLYMGYTGGAIFNNARFKEYIVYSNQTVNRTGVDSNIITYYGL